MFVGRHVYAALALITLLAAAAPAPVLSQSMERSYWAEYRMNMSVELGGFMGGESVAAEATIRLYMNFSGDNVTLGVCVLNYTSSGNASLTTSLGGEGCSSMSFRAGSAIPAPDQLLLGRSSPGTVNATGERMEPAYTYIGDDEYKGYPVHVYRINISYTNTSIYSLGNYTIPIEFSFNETGILYLHRGLHIPVYINVTASMKMPLPSLIQWLINATGQGVDEDKLYVSMKYTMVFDIEESNLPSTAPSKVIDAGPYYIVVGGEPDARIHIRGTPGSRYLVVNNTGTGYGYVSIIEKTASLQAGDKTGNRADYVVAPQSSLRIDAGTPPSREIDEDVAGTAAPPSHYVYTIIFISIALLLAALLILLLRKTR